MVKKSKKLSAGQAIFIASALGAVIVSGFVVAAFASAEDSSYEWNVLLSPSVSEEFLAMRQGTNEDDPENPPPNHDEDMLISENEISATIGTLSSVFEQFCLVSKDVSLEQQWAGIKGKVAPESQDDVYSLISRAHAEYATRSCDITDAGISVDKMGDTQFIVTIAPKVTYLRKGDSFLIEQYQQFRVIVDNNLILSISTA